MGKMKEKAEEKVDGCGREDRTGEEDDCDRKWRTTRTTKKREMSVDDDNTRNGCRCRLIRSPPVLQQQ